MSDNEFLRSLFLCIDSKDSSAVMQFLAAGCSFRLGNLPAVTGRESIGATVTGFFASLRSLSHTLAESWHSPAAATATARSAIPGTTAQCSRCPFP